MPVFFKMFFKFTAVQICISDMYRALLITAMESNCFQSLWLQANAISTKKKTNLRIKKIENANVVEELA